VIEFPATRWSLIARLPGQPADAALLVGLYADAIGVYLQAKLAGERPERIADVVQEVLLDLLGKPEALARAKAVSGSRFRHYLMHLAWQAALNVLRAYRRRDAPPAAEEPVIDGTYEAGMDRAWALSVLHQAMDELRAACADGRLAPECLPILTSQIIDGRPLREVAKDTGLSLATCSRRLALARTHLHAAIVERLRLAGELAPDEDPHMAGSRLLALLQ